MTQENENTQELEIEEPTLQEQGAGIIEEMLVELGDPLEIPLSSGKVLSITQEQFISYYLPKDATREEKFHCFNQTRAAGLNPAIRGQCHYFRAGGGPLQLFTGYLVYVNKAYANGMEHMEEPVWEIGEDGLPISCTLTIHIKGREPFTRTTRYAEVVGLQGGKPNSRWARAPFQMTEKCTTTNNIRLSGLLEDLDLPYTIDEMPDPAAVGHRTTTQERLDAYGEQEAEQEPAEIKSVSATHHQIDLSGFQRKYRAMLKEISLFNGDTERKNWQEHEMGARSSADFDVDMWTTAFAKIASGAALTWCEAHRVGPDPSGGGGLADQPHLHKDKPGEMIGAKTAEELQGGEGTEKQAEHGWADQAAMETENVNGHLPLDKDGDPLEDGMMTEEDAKAEAESQESFQLEIFLTECALRFKTDEDRNHWIAGLVESKPMEEWTGTEIALIMKQLMFIDELPKDAQGGADNAGGVKDGAEPENEQEAATEEQLKGAEGVFMLEAGKRMTEIVQLREWCFENVNAETPYEEWTPQQFFDALPLLEAVSLPMLKTTLAEIRMALEELPGKVFQTMKSNKFKAFASDALGLEQVMKTITERNEEEAQTVLAALLEKKSALLLAALDTGEVVDENPLDQGDPITTINDEQVVKIDKLIPEMPERFHGITGSQAFRDFAIEKTGRMSYPGIREFTGPEGDEIIRAMLKEVVVEKERKAKIVNPKDMFKTG